ncbi:MAG: alkaline phytoceramidase [Candidatus Rokubacteria bacterium]|nr:alkaline phytoceramidase [Candidatus Rokubacteria bacterium]
MSRPRRAGVLVLVGTALAAIAAVLALPPIPQDPRYHEFADRRTILGVPNFLNVGSNAAFVLVGGLGLAFVLGRTAARPSGPFGTAWERGAFALIFAAAAATGLGSAYYHLAPTTGRLFWDRLPITVSVTGLLGATIKERIGTRLGRWLFLPLVGAGIASAVHWHLGELRGAGDLRFYALVQFYPMLAIPLLVWLCPPRYTRGRDLVETVGWYAAARVFELLDAPVFALGGHVGGHTVKHLLSAVAGYWILRMVRARRPIAASADGRRVSPT